MGIDFIVICFSCCEGVNIKIMFLSVISSKFFCIYINIISFDISFINNFVCYMIFFYIICY